LIINKIKDKVTILKVSLVPNNLKLYKSNLSIKPKKETTIKNIITEEFDNPTIGLK
jgi:hypothetical protein|tara:strand:+ start:303 stop:470 length:168 start_codon:yes stop_codon:yes gene_type:complete